MSFDTVLKGLYDPHNVPLNLFDLNQVYGENDAAHNQINRIIAVSKSVGVLCPNIFEARSKQNPHAPWSVLPHILKENTLGNSVQKEADRKKSGLNVEVNYSLEVALGSGTAFLIGKDVALTAAHCFYKSHEPNALTPQCPQFLVFDFKQNPHQNGKMTDSLAFDSSCVYRVKSVFAHEIPLQSKGRDWVILKLDREVKDREPLKIDFEATIETQKNVWMLGHPRGLPLKWAGRATVQRVNSKLEGLGKDYFESDLAAFRGNSGSPIFYENESTVIGMLCRGNPDFGNVNEINGRNLYREHLVDSKSIEMQGYEHSIKMTSLVFLKSILPFISQPSHKEPFCYKNGLSLEGHCTSTACKDKLVVIHKGFIANMESMNRACYNAECPDCKEYLDYRRVDWIVLAKCRYAIEARNKLGEKVEGAYDLRHIDGSSPDGGEIRICIDKWSFMMLKAEQLPES